MLAPRALAPWALLLVLAALLGAVSSASGAATATGSMATARANHVAVPLPSTDGTVTKVLVTGGQNAAGASLASTEIYDVATGTWSPGPSLGAPRVSPSAVPIPIGTGTLPQGGVFLIGGTTTATGGTPATIPEIYNVATNTWTQLTSFTLTPARTGITMTIAGSRVVIAGGTGVQGVVSNAVQIFDAATNTPVPNPPPLISPRTGHAATVLPGGRVLVAGGFTGVTANAPATATAETFDPATPTTGWTATAPMSTARAGHTVSPADATRGIAVGGVPTAAGAAGATAELYDPLTNAWAPAGAMTTPRTGHRAVTMRPGWVAVTGGTNAASAAGIDSVDSWTPAFGWGGLFGRPAPEPIGGARLLHTATAIPQTDEILIAGGGAPPFTPAGPPGVTAAAVRYTPERPPAPPVTPPADPSPAPPTPTPAPLITVPLAAAPDRVPVEGVSVAVTPVSGKVFVRIGRTDEYRELRAGEAVPLGTVIDTTDGRIRLTSAIGGRLQTADFFGGTFKIRQPRGEGGLIELRLVGKPSCGSAKGRPQGAAAVKRKRKPRLWGDGRGRFRTRGANGSATVRGTRWLVEDRCSGTFVRVTRGSVGVRDFPKHRSSVLRAPGAYLARARS